MPITLDIEKLKENYRHSEEGINPEKVKTHIDGLYKADPIYPNPPNYDNIQEVAHQVDQMCTYLEDIGVKGAGALRDKFKSKPFSHSDAKKITDIKETMEAMVYSMANSSTPEQELGQKYSKHRFLCKAGTLTNLQGIVGELCLEGQGVGAYIVEQKEELVTAITLEMYNAGKFSEFPSYKRQQYGNEIHNISSLKNAIADDYGVIKKSSEDDHYVRNVGETSKQILAQGLQEKFSQPEVINSFIERISGKVAENLPHFDKDTENYPKN